MKAPPTLETLVPREATGRTPVTGLSPELLAQSARRLRIVALLYAFVFFMSNPEDRPATADALAGRLATIEMGSNWTPERARQWWDVHHPAQLKVSAASDLRTY